MDKSSPWPKLVTRKEVTFGLPLKTRFYRILKALEAGSKETVTDSMDGRSYLKSFTLSMSPEKLKNSAMRLSVA
jgi:hypothetical protein